MHKVDALVAPHSSDASSSGPRVFKPVFVDWLKARDVSNAHDVNVRRDGLDSFSPNAPNS
jgi:hypothetical protein